MTETLPKYFMTLDHHMSSQAGINQDFTAYQGHHPPSFIVGTEKEPDSQFRQEYSQQQPIAPSEMGIRFMTITNPDTAHFNSETVTSHNSIYSVDSSLSNSASSRSYSSLPHVVTSGLATSPAYSNSVFSYLPPDQNSYIIPDIKPNLASFNSVSDMAPPSSRSPRLAVLNVPLTSRELYIGVMPQFRRTNEFDTRSPSTSGTMRGVPASPSPSSGFASPANIESAPPINNPLGLPPLNPTEILRQLQTSDGQTIRPEIIGKIDKGFFLADNDWTCYRRNYFQMTCAYTLHPLLPTATLYLMHNNSSVEVHGLAVGIGAVVDGHDGRAIELVQHTPKRDKGPQFTPGKITLLPRPHNMQHLYPGMSGDRSTSRSMFDPDYQHHSGPPTEHTYERIQFKQATQNNGKRRAAQQYYHVFIELYADLGPTMGLGRYIKIAQRVSAQMVVRGRSPGHYDAERRGSNASAGPGGSNGHSQSGGPASYVTSPTLGRGSEVQLSVPQSQTIQSTSGYSSAYDARSRQYLVATGRELPGDPMLSAEDVKSFTDTDNYLYYPHTIHEANIGSHSRLHSMTSYHGNDYGDDRSRSNSHQYGIIESPNSPSHRIKQEYQHTGISLPSLTASNSYNSYGRHCGRFEGVATTRGYYPTATFSHQGINTS